MTAPRRKHWIMARADPVITPGYPHPECITGGWEALLTAEQKRVVDAKVFEMRCIDGGFYNSYTGFDALDVETQKSIRDKLDANKRWEKEHGPLWFRTPDPLDPRLLILPDTNDHEQQTEWRGKHGTGARSWLSSRRRQVRRMIARDGYPVRKYIAPA